MYYRLSLCSGDAGHGASASFLVRDNAKSHVECTDIDLSGECSDQLSPPTYPGAGTHLDRVMGRAQLS